MNRLNAAYISEIVKIAKCITAAVEARFSDLSQLIGLWTPPRGGLTLGIIAFGGPQIILHWFLEPVAAQIVATMSFALF